MDQVMNFIVKFSFLELKIEDDFDQTELKVEVFVNQNSFETKQFLKTFPKDFKRIDGSPYTIIKFDR